MPCSITYICHIWHMIYTDRVYWSCPEYKYKIAIAFWLIGSSIIWHTAGTWFWGAGVSGGSRISGLSLLPWMIFLLLWILWTCHCLLLNSSSYDTDKFFEWYNDADKFFEWYSGTDKLFGDIFLLEPNSSELFEMVIILLKLDECLMY